MTDRGDLRTWSTRTEKGEPEVVRRPTSLDREGYAPHLDEMDPLEPLAEGSRRIEESEDVRCREGNDHTIVDSLTSVPPHYDTLPDLGHPLDLDTELERDTTSDEGIA